jgi:hypothetical protein
VAYQVNGSRVEWNPTAARLRELTEEMPNATLTEFGNVNVKARVDSRSTRSTYIVDDSTNSRGQTITRAEYDRIAAIQDAHIAKSRMVVVDGYIGSDPQFRTRARLMSDADILARQPMASARQSEPKVALRISLRARRCSGAAAGKGAIRLNRRPERSEMILTV